MLKPEALQACIAILTLPLMLSYLILQGNDPLHYARTAGALKPEALRPLLAPDLPCFKVPLAAHDKLSEYNIENAAIRSCSRYSARSSVSRCGCLPRVLARQLCRSASTLLLLDT